MKRITSIEIENFRAFHGKYNKMRLPNAENVLIYGENGSGKSSLFKAINDYLFSSRDNSKEFVKNRYSETFPGNISLEFSEVTLNPIEVIPNTQQEFQFTDNGSNNNLPFIQVASLAKGFLEYRNLLDVYLHKEPRPNLFDLIVKNLLANYIPSNYGATYNLGQKWIQLQTHLLNARSRRGILHKQALVDLVAYETNLRGTLNEIFNDTNRLLNDYFPGLGIQITYELQRCNFNYGHSKGDWNTKADLRLNVFKDAVQIQGDYSDVLNEARLSAFAICLYLASLLRNPKVDFQILYLDDIFVGLDAGNRLPILEIVVNEFSDYQIFISTYDRHWYELAKRYFETHNSRNWLSLEFYVGSHTENGITFDKPTITKGISNYDKGIKFLHHNTDPDYPASANYFRKYIEEIIPLYIPQYEISDGELHRLPEHKVTQLLYRSKGFLRKTGNDHSSVDVIISLLHGLIHPLSHYTIKSPIYKAELISIEKAIAHFEAVLVTLDVQNNYKCLLPLNKKIKLTFCANQQANHYYFYEIVLKTPLVIKRGPSHQLEICSSICAALNYYGHNGHTYYKPGHFQIDNPSTNYDSLENAYNTIYTFLTSTFGNFPYTNSGYLSCCEYYDGSSWQPLTNLIVWP